MEDQWIPITLINQSKAESNCRFLSVTQETVGKLKKIRPGVYLDDPRLMLVKDLPEHKKQPQTKAEPQISPEQMARAEASWAAHYMVRQAIQTVKPLGFEEQIQHNWRHSPALRKEFTSFGSYQAYMRAAESGRCRA